MRDPELAKRAGNAAARLEQAWERWRTLHGLAGPADSLAAMLGYSLKEPMGQRACSSRCCHGGRVLRDFLENHDCAAVAQEELRPVNGSAHLPVQRNELTAAT